VITSSEERIKTELKEYIHEGVETIMAGIDGITEQLAEKKGWKSLSET
jgi:hypothetical protein